MQRLKTLIIVVLASLIGTVASCGTMGGGGGMRYLVEPPAPPSTAT
jgi:hypothetical protein